MHRIFSLESDWSQFSPEEFKTNVLEACENARTTGDALLFAFVMYRLEDAHVSKMLADDAYFEGLSSVSGSLFYVFVLAAALDKQLVVHDNLKGMMPVDRWKLPCLLLFQVKDRQVVNAFTVGIDDASVDAAFTHSKTLLHDIGDVLSRIAPENADNAEEIFCLVRDRLESRERVVRVAGLMVPVARFVGTAIRLVGG